MAIATGQKAPTFSLYNSAKEKVSLEDYAGKKNVLLLFFPLAFTSVCTQELCSVRDDIGRYEKADAAVIGISVDSPYVLAKYKEEQGFNFQLLSDFNRDVSAAYDSVYDFFGNMKMQGISKRAAFIIDKQGVVQYVEILDNPGLVPDFTTINNIIERLS